MSATVLVVDDDAGLQETLAAILEDAGYRVLLAGDGYQALETLAEQRPALILLDIGLPRMDGFAFAAELGARGLHPGIPLPVLTADGNAAAKAQRVGAVGYLAKPFALDALLAQRPR
jgi:CheY-like chemotaxis protein